MVSYIGKKCKMIELTGKNSGWLTILLRGHKENIDFSSAYARMVFLITILPIILKLIALQ